MAKNITAKPRVGILMGSDSDLEVMRETEKRLDYFGIAYETRIMSAHRTPDKAAKYAATAQQRGLEVIICGAGAAAHLAGAIAANTTLPVIGIPIDSSSLKGLDVAARSHGAPPNQRSASVVLNGCRHEIAAGRGELVHQND